MTDTATERKEPWRSEYEAERGLQKAAADAGHWGLVSKHQKNAEAIWHKAKAEKQITKKDKDAEQTAFLDGTILMHDSVDAMASTYPMVFEKEGLTEEERQIEIALMIGTVFQSALAKLFPTKTRRELFIDLVKRNSDPTLL